MKIKVKGLNPGTFEFASKMGKGYDISLLMYVEENGDIHFDVTCYNWNAKKKIYEEGEMSFKDIETAVDRYNSFK